MSHLVPCPACHRHVRAHESTCPFCAAALPAAPAAPALPTGRMSRAAVFVAGAAVAGAAATGAAACGGSQAKGPDVVHNQAPDAGADETAPPDAASVTDPVLPDHIQPMPYGVPPLRERIV